MTQVTDACRFLKMILARDSHAVPETVLVRPRPEPVGQGRLRCAFEDRPIARSTILARASYRIRDTSPLGA